jgi:benzoate/toluate 1,2-dioxygenase beta subunit
METPPDPSVSSYYIDDAFYRALVENFSDWTRPEQEIADPALRDACRRLLEREARLLDHRRFDEWLSLYARECLYWVPATPEGGDPRREVAISFDDRRRLEDSVFRLKTGYAWSQVPPSRTTRLITNVEVFETPDAAIYMVRSTFLISEFRAGETRVLSGWSGHRLAQRQGGGWEILVKQVNLVDCDQNLRNPSIIL